MTPSISLNSSIGDMLKVDGLQSGSAEDKQKHIRWCSDIQGQTLIHIERVIDDPEFNAVHRADLLEFLAGVGKVITGMANEVRDAQDIETHD